MASLSQNKTNQRAPIYSILLVEIDRILIEQRSGSQPLKIVTNLYKSENDVIKPHIINVLVQNTSLSSYSAFINYIYSRIEHPTSFINLASPQISKP
nr:hypothetical protein CFP56_18232 [Quercus suber]